MVARSGWWAQTRAGLRAGSGWKWVDRWVPCLVALKVVLGFEGE